VALRQLKERMRRVREEIILRARDLEDALRGRRDPLVPPRRLLFDGPRDPELYRESGREFLGHYVDLCGLQPDEDILDVGSGIGRKTIPLTGYLAPAGRYLGLDVNPVGIAWCRKRISSRWPNFQFRHVDVYNRRYNPKGTCRAEDSTFPVEDGCYDLVVLASVFTHMLPAGVERYLHEVARVLRPGSGRCLISFFLLDEAAEAGIAASRSTFSFPHRSDRHAVESEDSPEDAVAYEEGWVRGLYLRTGLEVAAIHHGSWSGREGDTLSFQDLVLAYRPESPGA
jgi:SAM-dependent methyltransferase